MNNNNSIRNSQSQLLPTKEDVYRVVAETWSLLKQEYPKWDTADYWKETNNFLRPWLALEDKYAELARSGKPGAAAYPFMQRMCVAYTRLIDDAWNDFYRQKFAGEIEREEE